MPKSSSVSKDASYKELFSFPRLIEDLLRGFIREPWVEEVDFSTLEKTNAHYVSPDQSRRSSDMVWRLEWGESPVYIYILMEFQATSPRHMALRMNTYLALFYEDLHKQKQLIDGKLPAVLPIVLYSGVPTWKAPCELAELIIPVPGLERYCPSLRYLLLDERRLAAEAAELAPNLAGAVFRLEAAETYEAAQAVVAELLEWLPGQRDSELRTVFTAWIRNVILEPRLPDVELPEVSDLKELQRTMATQVIPWTHTWEQKGIEKGIQTGRRQGEQSLFLRLLKRKFGQLDPPTEIRIEAASEEQLLGWADRLVTADSLDQVFKD